MPRKAWKHADDRRPLDERGLRRADDLVPLLGAYAFTRVVASSSVRCAGTVAPYATTTGTRLRLRRALSEEGHAAHPHRAAQTVERLLDRGEPAALCSHRPVLPAVLAALGDRARDTRVADRLRESAKLGLVKGEALVAHVHGRGAAAQVVAVERHGLA
ncbi:hypothetical protein GCM10025868_28110 [Angustibacter aerolatus]|uniref:Uncharacterized protein n=1 Tax=Angustibacter aerolatus TaxID=1162965 RepID=A0ABQ6JL81_9ACTN|nr:hypothetical protein GCM10025868_28110 [Angustibacter aerolatus]